MKIIKQLLAFICCFTVLVSCNSSNSLTQENAENTIRKFLTDHSIKTSNLEVSPAAIQKTGKTNIYAQFHTSVRVYFNSEEQQPFTLLFDFTRTPHNKWFLRSVEGIEGPLQELTNWLETNKNLNIAAQ